MLLTVDSSVIIASLVEEEKYHDASKRLMDKVLDAKHTAIIPYSVFVEVAGALKRRTGSEELSEIAGADLQNMAAVYLLELSKERALEAAEIAKKTGLKGMDAIVVQVAKESSSALITLDKSMSDAAKEIVKVLFIETLDEKSEL